MPLGAFLMERIADFEVWRQIPPEEKLLLMSRAQGNGIMASVITVIVACTVAVGLKIPALIWVSLIVSPLIYQVTASKAWRDLRPKIMLEYLAARSAARRYAYAANAQDLGVAFLFRGEAEELFDKDHMQDAIEAIIDNNNDSSVWIALFNDALVLLAEQRGGAKCELAALLNEKMQMEVKNAENEGDYSNNKEIYLTVVPERGTIIRRLKITSRNCPAALVVLEKKIAKGLEEAKNAKPKPSIAAISD